MDVKRCRKCGETKPVEMFPGNGRRWDGLHHSCRTCLGVIHEAKREKAQASYISKVGAIREIGAELQPEGSQAEVNARREAKELAASSKAEARLKKIQASEELAAQKAAKAVAKALQEHQRKIEEASVKRCRNCTETKPVEMFSQSKRHKGGVYSCCKICVEAMHEARLARAREYHNPNSELLRKIRQPLKDLIKEYYFMCAQNSEHMPKVFNFSSVEGRRAYDRAYAAANPDKILAKLHRRRAHIKGNGGSFTSEELQTLRKAQNHQCAYCKRLIKLTVDHIIPISKKGSNDISNICMACGRCNRQKSARTPAQWIKRWYLLEPYNPDAP